MVRPVVTIRDVAREAGVSVATVSRALNGHANVAEPVRKQVEAVAQRLRYSPHGAARSLSSRSTQTIGVVLPDLHGEFFSELIRGIGAGARARRKHMLLSSYHGDPEQQAAALRAMRGRVDGLLVMSPFADQPGFLEENLPPLPAVLVNTHQAEPAWPAFEVDNHAGAMAMTAHLLALGHRRIAFIAGPEHNYDGQRCVLDDVQQLLLGQLEHGQEGHQHAQAAFLGGEQRLEAVEAAVVQPLQHLAHALADAQRLAPDGVAAEQLGPAQHVVQGQQHLAQVHRRRQADGLAVRHVGLHRQGVAFHARQRVQVLGRLLEALVLLQAAHQLGARVGFLAVLVHRPRQQHP